MKSSMQYEANQTNLFNIWEIQVQRLNHIRRLNTIYRQSQNRRQQQKNKEIEISRLTSIALHHKNFEADKVRKQKFLQQQINQSNNVLRMKLLQVSASSPSNQKQYLNEEKEGEHQPIVSSKERKAVFLNKTRSNMSYQQKQHLKKIQFQNHQLYIKLNATKGEVLSRTELKDHLKKIEHFKEMIEKKSPKKMSFLKSFFKKRNLQYGSFILPHLQSDIQSQAELTLVQNPE